MIKLNLGCSDALYPGFLNVDIWKPPNAPPELFLQADLRNKWPWDDSSIVEIRAYDIIEHLPDMIHTMNEAWRVLMPGGVFDIVVPTTDGRGAFQDPQHVSFWNSNSFFYYCEEFPEWQRFHEAYGTKCRFRVPGSFGSVKEAANILSGNVRLYAHGVTKLDIKLVAVK